jgi:hypothetical protein
VQRHRRIAGQVEDLVAVGFLQAGHGSETTIQF